MSILKILKIGKNRKKNQLYRYCLQRFSSEEVFMEHKEI